MAKYFSGTSTGNKYEVGRDYVTGDGRVLTAQADGSFVKQGNLVAYTDAGKPIVSDAGRGAVSVGSSGNPDVEWYATAGTRSAASPAPVSGASVASAGGRGSPSPAQANQGDGLPPPGTQRVANPVTSGSLAYSRVAAAASGGGFGALGRIAPWSGIDDPAQHYSVAGLQMIASPRSSNMAMVEERHGDAEFLSPAWFASWAIAADDYVHNVSYRAYGPNHENRDHRNAVQKAFVEDVGQNVVDAFVNSVGSVRATAADAANAERARQELERYKLELTRTEALKGGDWTAIPGVAEQRVQAQRKRDGEAQGWVDWIGRGL